MKVIDLDRENEQLYLVCLEEWSETLGSAKHVKENWYRKMKELGLRVKIAFTDDGVAGGMIEYMPVEHYYTTGEDAYIVNCIWVHGYPEKGRGNLQKIGLGTALLKAAEDDVKAMGKKGLAAWGISEKFWMSASWYEKHGYTKVDQEGWLVLVFKSFSPDAVPPKWIKGEYTQEPVPGKVKITAFFSGQCCSENSVYLNAKKAALEFPANTVFEEIDMSIPGNRRKYGLKGGLYINGENLFTGHPPSYDDIVKKIQEKLSPIA